MNEFLKNKELMDLRESEVLANLKKVLGDGVNNQLAVGTQGYMVTIPIIEFSQRAKAEMFKAEAGKKVADFWNSTHPGDAKKAPSFLFVTHYGKIGLIGGIDVREFTAATFATHAKEFKAIYDGISAISDEKSGPKHGNPANKRPGLEGKDSRDVQR